MAIPKRWQYEGTVPGSEAEGRPCVFCNQVITRESVAAQWMEKVVEDDPDIDYPTRIGYAHLACSDRARAAERRRGQTELPEVPDLPRRKPH